MRLDPQPVPAPLLDLVEVAAVGIERIVGLLIGPVAKAFSPHYLSPASARSRSNMHGETESHKHDD
jgi:hypothetical protein